MRALSILPCVAAIVAVLQAAAVQAQTQPASDPITVSVLTPLTGSLAILGQDGKKGLEIAVQQINDAGGINGRRLSVEFTDSQGKPDVARREMERLVRLQKAPLVVGCDISAATSTAAQFAEASQTPFFNVSAVSSEIINRHYQWYFTQQITSNDEADTTVAFLKLLAGGDAELKGQKIALLYEDSPRGTDSGELVRKLLERAEAKPVIEVSYNRAERNLLPIMKKVQEKEPTILVWAGYTEDVVAGIKAMQQLDFTPYVVGIGGGPGDPRLPELVDPKFIERLKLSNIDYFSPDLKRVAHLTEQYRKKFNALPSSYVGMCYAGGVTLGKILQRAYERTASPTREDLQKLLRGFELDSDQTPIPGGIKFDADGRNTGARALVAQWKEGASRKATVFPSNIATSTTAPLR
ncbi:ABC transporter substrate-binding protein [Bradyrhizobium sp. 195]|uniref:ABC transporter substrate-binding protein n=1 Tax=Bradyrhizobium sp. 195 TaxID=2782662 RepID=UPI002000A5B5|nr:ABC transporter substrate-binding protein [Bradyrhizobium sp. 195]UPK29937.1 ABC transporter substrate-binding protein [Bradyrhizobium sp. 195]